MTVKDFMKWLDGGENITYITLSKWTSCCFLRIEKNSDFSYLYVSTGSGPELIRGQDFKYAGLYCKADGQLYDEQYELYSLFGYDYKPHSIGKMQEELQESVRQEVERIIANDRNSLQISALSNPDMKARLKNFQGYAFKSAREYFLEHDDCTVPEYECTYKAQNWTENSLLSFILDNQGYIFQEASDYISQNQEEILLGFLCNDALLAEYEKLLADADNPVHIVKRIMKAVSSVPAKTVNVTLLKEGNEFTFKTEVNELKKDCDYYYHDWCMAAPDRKKFEEQFGKNAKYYPAEIVRITYARKVLYEALQIGKGQKKERRE